MKLNIPQKYYPLAIFLVFAVMVTLISLTSYAVVQQIYRANADDPQIEAAEEIAGFINQGAPLDAIVDTTRSTDIAASLGTFVIVYNNEKTLIGGSGQLDGETPTPPQEAFEASKGKQDHRFTWEPQAGVRIATVIKAADNEAGYILVGRNLREVEQRQHNITNMIGIAWIGLLILAGLLTWLITKLAEQTDVTIIEENITIETKESNPDDDLKDDSELN